MMRLRRLVLDLQASFGITSSVGDGKPGPIPFQGCSFGLNIEQGWIHKTESHRGER